MKFISYRLIPLILVFSFSLTSAKNMSPSDTLNSDSDPLEKIYTQTLKHKTSDFFQIPSLQAQIRFETLFREFIAWHENPGSVASGILIKDASNLGFEINRFQTEKGIFSILSEKANLRFGGGFYVLHGNPKNGRPVIIQTPHARSDTYTGLIGIRTFERTSASGFFSSSMRRNQPAVSSLPTTGPCQFDAADPAHNNQHFFQIAHRVYAQIHPDLMVIQIHGFKENPDDPLRNYDIVISAGTTQSHAPLAFPKLQAVLVKTLPFKKIAKFDHDTKALGALTNIQGRYINAYTSGVFIHIECSKKARRTLKKSARILAKFANSLEEVIRNYENI